MKLTSLIIFLIFNFYFSHSLLAATPGVILAYRGQAQLLDKQKKLSKTLSFKGEIFYYDKLKLGQKVLPGQFIKCDPGCNVKVGFANGDSIYVGPGTTMEIPKIIGSKKSDVNQLELYYGKIRAIISPKGPRKKLKVRTRSAVTGVRGTDLFVSYNDYAGHQTSVVRGEVSVAPTTEISSTVSASDSQVLKSGEVASIKVDNPAIEKRKVNRAELKDIQQMALEKSDADALKDITPESKQEIEKIEKKVAEVIIEDVKKHHPKLVESLSKGTEISAADLNSAAIEQLLAKAPEGQVEWEQKSPAISPPNEVANRPHWANKLELTIVLNRYQNQGSSLKGGKSTGARAAWNPRLFSFNESNLLEGVIGVTPSSGTQFDPENFSESSYYHEESILGMDLGVRYRYSTEKYFLGFGIMSNIANVKFSGLEFMLGVPAHFLPGLDSMAFSFGGRDWNPESGKSFDSNLYKEPVKNNTLSFNSFWRF